MTDELSVVAAKPRGRGRPPRVSRSSIIDAARSLPADELSMQAVADRLGVDRSTINYHFTDRAELFATVASVALSERLADYTPPDSPDWREWVVSYAKFVYGALVAHGAITLYVPLPVGRDASSLAPGEGLIQKLSEAGLGETSVAHAMGYISEVVHAMAQNQVLVSQGGHPQGAELIQFLATQSPEVLPGLRGLTLVQPLGSDAHLDFALRMIVAGIEAELASSPEPVPAAGGR